MERIDPNIDGGRAFDWGKTSEDYAKYRDVYPPIFYQKIVENGLCVKGQAVLDLGTGTGVLPRNLYRYGARWIGIDASGEQIAQAKRLSQGMEIDYNEACDPRLRGFRRGNVHAGPKDLRGIRLVFHGHRRLFLAAV